MNWMTSAKNRVQSKRKKHDSLRLAAYSKLLPHSFDSKSSTSQSTVGSQMRRPCDEVDVLPQQSKDVLLLANSSRKRKVIADHPLTQRLHTEKFSPKDKDHLKELELSPLHRYEGMEEFYPKVEEQDVLYFNDGVLCDQLGRMVVQVSAVSSGHHSREHTSNTITPNREDSSLDAAAVLDGSDNEWWFKLMALLDNGIDMAKLYHVCQELSSREITPPQHMTTRGSSCDDADAHYASRVLSKSLAPSPRDALSVLYRAVATSIRDDQANMVIYDAIRLIELVDKQIFDSSRGGGGHAACRLDELTDAAPHTKEGGQAVMQLPIQEYSATAPPVVGTEASTSLEGWDLFGGALDGHEAPPSSSLTVKSSSLPIYLTEGDLDLDDFL